MAAARVASHLDQLTPFRRCCVSDRLCQLLSFVERLAVYRNERLFILID
jgi:hypothetical protein